MKSTSELLTYQSCPQLWANQYLHKRAPKDTPPDATDRGSTAHFALEQRLERELSNESMVNTPLWWRTIMEDHYGRRCVEKNSLPSDKHLKELEILSISMCDYWNTDAHNGLLLGAEVVLDNGSLMGILDALIQRDGKLWHRQYKTLGRSSDMATLVRRVKRSLHESVYATLIEHNYPKHEYMGTELVMFPLDGLHKRAAKHTCSHCGIKGYEYRPPTYEVIDLPIRSAIRDRATRDCQRVLDQIDDSTENHPFVTMEQREGACFNYNRICPFIDVCDGHLTIDDDNYFRDRDPHRRYRKDAPLGQDNHTR